MQSPNSAQLEAFFVCAQTKNFTQAAQRLHITQSALSQRIMNLEESLETTLFIRDRSGLRLTEAGDILLRYSIVKEKIEADWLGQIRKKADGALSGQLRIGGYSSIMRSVVLPSLSGLLNDQAIQLRLVTRELYELNALLKSGEIDFMLHSEPHESETFTQELLGYEKLVLIRKRGSADSETYLDHDERDRTTLDFLKLKRSEKIHRHYLDDIYGIIDGVHLGFGQAVVPWQLIKEDRQIEIVKKYKPQMSPVYLIYYQQPYYSKLQLKAIELLKSQARLALSDK